MGFLVGLVAGVVALYAVAGRRGELSGAAASLARVHFGWLAVATGAELASIVAYAAVQGRMLAAGGVDLGLGSLTLIAFAAYAIQNSLPAGPAWSGLFAFREYRRRGADGVTAAWTLIVVPVLSGACLAAIAVVGTALAGGPSSSFGLIWVILAVGVVATALILAMRPCAQSPGLCSAAVRVVRTWQRLVRRPRRDAEEFVQSTRKRLVAVSPRRRDWAAAAGLAAANWAFDCACLVLAFVALGAAVPWRGLLLAYGGGQLAANLPITPGGLGVVEGSLTIGLVYYGGAEVTTVAAVLLYRIISFWALLPVGWTSWLALRVRAKRAEVEAA